MAIILPLTHLGGDKYRLDHDYSWVMVGGAFNYKLQIPKGFEFDLTLPNIPGIRKLINPHDIRWLEAALVHDYLLSKGAEKNVAASEFRRVLRAVGIGSIKSWFAFFAVLWFTNTFKEKSR